MYFNKDLYCSFDINLLKVVHLSRSQKVLIVSTQETEKAYTKEPFNEILFTKPLVLIIELKMVILTIVEFF